MTAALATLIHRELVHLLPLTQNNLKHPAVEPRKTTMETFSATACLLLPLQLSHISYNPPASSHFLPASVTNRHHVTFHSLGYKTVSSQDAGGFLSGLPKIEMMPVTAVKGKEQIPRRPQLYQWQTEG